VMQGEILIVDEHTGRLLSGRRYSEGLHQSLEAKENVEIQPENQTLATITLQNYFRLYDKLSGMTGTAMTEANEFSQIYNLGVVPIPTNKPMTRADEPDLVYRTEKAKFDAVVDDIFDSHEAGQPVLVGTVSVEKSEYLSQALRKRGVKHEVLNAKHHDREAQIVAQAGTSGAVTVATNMAGRGTDIMLGGNSEFMAAEELAEKGLSPVDTPEEYEAAWSDALERAQEAVKRHQQDVIEAGGLYVLGTERHESRRIDNQLRGRSGRQGDPGETRFYLSLEDDLMRLFKADIVDSFLRRFNVPDDVPIEAGMVSKAIASAQTQREAQNFEIRKDVLKYDDVLNRQRLVVYQERKSILEGQDISDQVQDSIEETIDGYVSSATAEGYAEDWDLDQLWTALKQLYPVSVTPEQLVDETGGDASGLSSEYLRTQVVADALDAYAVREETLGERAAREFERRVFLSVLDRKWREHLHEMDHLRHGIGLRAMAQRDPLVEYQKEGYDLFSGMMDGIKEESVGYLFNAEVKVTESEPEQDSVREGLVDASKGQASRNLVEALAGAQQSPAAGSTEPEISAKGLTPSRPSEVQYSAPTAEGGASVRSGTVTEVDEEDLGATDPGASRAQRRRAQRARGKKGRK
jgi:preprotein translocase subunit SecA